MSYIMQAAYAAIHEGLNAPKPLHGHPSVGPELNSWSLTWLPQRMAQPIKRIRQLLIKQRPVSHRNAAWKDGLRAISSAALLAFADVRI